MNYPPFNWTSERQQISRFLSAPGVLHIIATEGCHDSAFLEVLRETAVNHDPPFVPCMLNSHNMASSTPLEALRTLFLHTGLDAEYKRVHESAPDSASIEARVGSNIKAWGDVTFNNVSVNVGTQSHSDSEELHSLVQFLAARIRNGDRFDNLLIVFTQCEAISDLMRRKFWATLWEPLFSQLQARGARFVFHYLGDNFPRLEMAIPPAPTATISLPKRLDASVVPQIAEHAAASGWHEGQLAEVFAQTIYDLSPSVADLHGHIVTITWQKGSEN